jgi:hypothetical protein
MFFFSFQDSSLFREKVTRVATVLPELLWIGMLLIPRTTTFTF